MDNLDASLDKRIIDYLENLTRGIREEKYNEADLQLIYTTLKNLNENPVLPDRKAIEYLFRGWWISLALENIPYEIDICPCCFGQMKNECNKEKNSNK